MSIGSSLRLSRDTCTSASYRQYIVPPEEFHINLLYQDDIFPFPLAKSCIAIRVRLRERRSSVRSLPKRLTLGISVILASFTTYGYMSMKNDADENECCCCCCCCDSHPSSSLLISSVSAKKKKKRFFI